MKTTATSLVSECGLLQLWVEPLPRSFCYFSLEKMWKFQVFKEFWSQLDKKANDFCKIFSKNSTNFFISLQQFSTSYLQVKLTNFAVTHRVFWLFFCLSSLLIFSIVGQFMMFLWQASTVISQRCGLSASLKIKPQGLSHFEVSYFCHHFLK